MFDIIVCAGAQYRFKNRKKYTMVCKLTNNFTDVII